MDNCDWCNLSEEDKQFQIYESKSWSIFLSDEQDYIGRCILVLKRHCPSLSELTDDEWDELRDLICKVEACLKTVLGATLCKGLIRYTGVMLKGKMEVLTDPETKEMIWRKGDTMYYPGGVTDPDYCVLRFTAESGRYYCDLKTESFTLK